MSPDTPAVEIPAPSLPPPPPRSPKKAVIIGGIVVSVLVLAGLAATAVLLLQGSATPETTPTPVLDSLPDSSSEIASETLPTITPSALPSPAAVAGPDLSKLLLPKTNVNLAVTIAYRQSENFSLSLEALARTYERPTADLYAPAARDPYSLLRLVGANGATIAETPFAVSTIVIGESAGSTANPLQPLAESTVYLVVPVSAQNPPVRVQVLGSSGQVFAEKALVFDQLPFKEVAIEDSNDLQVKPTSSPAAHRPLWGINEAQAQAPLPPPPTLAPTPTPTPPIQLPAPIINPPGGQFQTVPVTITITMPPGTPSGVTIYYTLDGSEPTTSSIRYTGPFQINETVTIKARAFLDTYLPSEITTVKIKICIPCFIIAVVGHKGTPIDATVAATQVMIDTIDPWSKYSDKVMVVPVANTNDLGCRESIFASGGLFPICPRDDLIHAAVSGITWHAIIVVNPTNCNCGTVTHIGNRITAVGVFASTGLLAHEIGHSVGKMVDEYFYKFGYTGGPLGPNCFSTATECTDKRNEFPDLECAPGCRAVEQTRPYSLLMHNDLGSPFGAFDACLMETEIVKVLSLPAKCENPDESPTPIPPTAVPGEYWGWRR